MVMVGFSCLHQNMSTHLKCYQFWDYQIWSQSISWYNLSKYWLQSHFLFSTTNLTKLLVIFSVCLRPNSTLCSEHFLIFNCLSLSLVWFHLALCWVFTWDSTLDDDVDADQVWVQSLQSMATLIGLAGSVTKTQWVLATDLPFFCFKECSSLLILDKIETELFSLLLRGQYSTFEGSLRFLVVNDRKWGLATTA